MYSDYNPILVLNVLKRDFPDQYVKVSDRLKSEMPAIILRDYGLMPEIIERFCDLQDIELNTWMNIPGKPKITHQRELLLAIIIKFYQPERISGLHSGRIKHGISKTLTRLLKCSKVVISQSIACAIDNYRIYVDFRDEVDQLYDNLKSNYHGQNS